MLDVYASWFSWVETSFVEVGEYLEKFKREEDNGQVAHEVIDEIIHLLVGNLTDRTSQLGMPVTADICQRIWQGHELPGLLTWGELRKFMTSLRVTWEHELQSKHFFCLDHHHTFYENPSGGWEDIIARFKCGDDVEEARKCLALGRSTAAVFHLMKIVEHGVLALAGC